MTTAPTEPSTEAKPATSRDPKRTQHVKRIVTSLGDKGGTSKTFLVRKIAEVHLGANAPKLMLVDGDSTVGGLFKFYGERDPEGNVVEQSPRGVQALALNGTLDSWVWNSFRSWLRTIRPGVAPSKFVVCRRPATHAAGISPE